MQTKPNAPVFSLRLSLCQASARAHRMSSRTACTKFGAFSAYRAFLGQCLPAASADVCSIKSTQVPCLAGACALISTAVSVISCGFKPLKPQRPSLSLTLWESNNKVGGTFLAAQASPHTLVRAGSGLSQEVLTELSATSVASMFGYSRRYQRAHFVRLSFIKYLRRYLLVLAQLRVNLGVVGAMRQFKGYFKTLNAPACQVFRHPLTGRWLSDVALVVKPGTLRSKAELIPLVENLVYAQQAVLGGVPPSTAVGGHSDEITTVVSDLVNFFWRLISREGVNLAGAFLALSRYRLA